MCLQPKLKLGVGAIDSSRKFPHFSVLYCKPLTWTRCKTCEYKLSEDRRLAPSGHKPGILMYSAATSPAGA